MIAEAIERKRFRVMIGNDARLFDIISRVIPQRGITMITNKMKDLVTARAKEAGV